jgi:large subunit ribosomal protein L23
MREPYQAVVRPLVTEKSSALYGLRKEYTFEANPNATKHEIRDAVERLFGVQVVSVRTLIQPAKRRTRGRTAGRRPRWKKAYVRLREGDSIEIFEG